MTHINSTPIHWSARIAWHRAEIMAVTAYGTFAAPRTHQAMIEATSNQSSYDHKVDKQRDLQMHENVSSVTSLIIMNPL